MKGNTTSGNRRPATDIQYAQSLDHAVARPGRNSTDNRKGNMGGVPGVDRIVLASFAPISGVLPASDALSQLRSVCIDIRRRAKALTRCPSLTHCTAVSLNSAAYTWCGTLNLCRFFR
ncbi:hypothetical protein DR64_7432 [Paraburkholderia xenovorans LB400]|uniref:Uncharacterized protein n=1 Tax=Paraburkholderia xenovorans (strain LB400) TaxID=266265 RepID=Q13G98_PARXL|nr:hypothetical protein Bxe_C1020 [Paraburkholderia xenovorans LB400]AIP34210.1 hypothetical protein DR64_7432 [Paraburkholderia xenovorans LB400]